MVVNSKNRNVMHVLFEVAHISDVVNSSQIEWCWTNLHSQRGLLTKSLDKVPTASELSIGVFLDQKLEPPSLS